MITWKEQTDAITLANGAFCDWHVRMPNCMHLKFSHQTDAAKYTRVTDTQTQKQIRINTEYHESNSSLTHTDEYTLAVN